VVNDFISRADMHPALLILNAGSSSLKFAIYQAGPVDDLQAEYRTAMGASRCFTRPTPEA
jgi:acetate kinase